ncbi:29253_t:CDS:2, partial [Racocetra persica]
MCESSALSQRRLDPILMGMKPDFTVRTANPNKHVELLIGEVKSPNTRDALVSEDLVCLGKMMIIKLYMWLTSSWIPGKSLCNGPPFRWNLSHDPN